MCDSLEEGTTDRSSLPVGRSAFTDSAPAHPVAKPATNTLNIQISLFEAPSNDVDLSSMDVAEAIVKESFENDNVSVDEVDVVEKPGGNNGDDFGQTETILVGVLVGVGGFLIAAVTGLIIYYRRRGGTNYARRSSFSTPMSGPRSPRRRSFSTTLVEPEVREESGHQGVSLPAEEDL